MGYCKFVKLPPSNIDRSRCTNLVAQRRTSFEKCLTALQHASQCSTHASQCSTHASQCSTHASQCSTWCVKMKRVLVHFSTRALTHPVDCRICAQFTALVRCHAEKCQIRDCKVMLCETFKREAKKTIAPVYQFPIPNCKYSLI